MITSYRAIATVSSTIRFLLLALLTVPIAAITPLTDEDLRQIPSGGDDYNIDTGKLLAPILIPRVSGTEGNFKTQRHFADFFKANLPEWELTWQNSTSKTPVSGDKDVPFSNLIFRRDPPWASQGDISRLTLVAHFDSKLTPSGFIGAIDSAAPCAMLMHLARSLEDAITAKWAAMEKDGSAGNGLDAAEGVQILFLDGEEAFLRWTDTDSLYGARSLAAEWEAHSYSSVSTFRSPLSSISLFVLLDLLGSPEPVIPSYFLTTHWAYKKMASLEKRMRDLGLLETKPKAPFLPTPDKEARSFGHTGISDDHVPFMQRGVDILHLIPSPFPSVWHEMEDDGEHLDLPTVRDWGKIVTAFTAEWMDLSTHMPKKAGKREEKKGEPSASSCKRTEL